MNEAELMQALQQAKGQLGVGRQQVEDLQYRIGFLEGQLTALRLAAMATPEPAPTRTRKASGET